MLFQRARIGHGANENTIQRRREIVADYLSRGIEIFAIISEAWAMEDIVNPHTGEPYVYQVYLQDRNWVRQQWAQINTEKIDFLVGDVVAKSKIVFRNAINDRDYKSALDALKSVREVLDIDKPKGSRALKGAADERNLKYNAPEMSEAESNEKAALLDNTPAVFGEMLQILHSVGAIDAALITESQQLREARELQSGLNDEDEMQDVYEESEEEPQEDLTETFPARRNGRQKQNAKQ